jgi:hypothetical protein
VESGVELRGHIEHLPAARAGEALVRRQQLPRDIAHGNPGGIAVTRHRDDAVLQLLGHH